MSIRNLIIYALLILSNISSAQDKINNIRSSIKLSVNPLITDQYVGGIISLGFEVKLNQRFTFDLTSRLLKIGNTNNMAVMPALKYNFIKTTLFDYSVSIYSTNERLNKKKEYLNYKSNINGIGINSVIRYWFSRKKGVFFDFGLGCSFANKKYINYNLVYDNMEQNINKDSEYSWRPRFLFHFGWKIF
ncbi:MAG TPA: hypothetical protein DDX39_01480 [Bacteroidales bacterium]|nr:MAG: hypothetical protein A2W98_07695 [Bacteroidetes bacterium GWF2_33_38]HBF87283.1 hypothetical protein [Bacteroidales bacterium]